METQKAKQKTFNYREQHAVVIIVQSESEQKALYEKLKKDGFTKLKVVSV